MPISRVRRATATDIRAYRPAAEKTIATSRMLPNTTLPTTCGTCRCATSSSRVTMSRSCSPASICRARAATRGARGAASPRDAHGDHHGIELRRGGCAIDVLSTVGVHPGMGDHADDLVPGPRLALTAPRERAD